MSSVTLGRGSITGCYHPGPDGSRFFHEIDTPPTSPFHINCDKKPPRLGTRTPSKICILQAEMEMSFNENARRHDPEISV